jgi:hypothetical protein
MSVANASPSTSSTTTSSGRPALSAVSLRSKISTKVSSITASTFSELVMKLGGEKAAVELHPFDHVKRDFGGLRFLDCNDTLAPDLVHGVGDSSPIAGSLWAEMAATCAI